MSDEALEDMFYNLEDGLKQGALGNQNFLPLDVLYATITAERLKAAFPSSALFGSSSLRKNILQYARKIFAILLFIGEPLAIKELLRLNLRDEDLPLAAGVDTKTRGKLIAADGRVFMPWKTAAKTSEFLDKQWLVQAPVFGTTGQHFILNMKCSMPLIDADEVGGGAFGYVYKCKLHQAHQKGHKVGIHICS
jgi:phage FluMu protein gp41